MIKLTNVSKRYKNGSHVITDMNLAINDGEFVYIAGESGAGKSTLIKLLDTEEVPTKGTVMVNDINVGKLKGRKISYYRRKIGVVYQNFNLLPKKNVFENISFALEVTDYPPKKIRERVKNVLKLVELSDKAFAYPNQLSGGQIQRVAIARAIATQPSILIADEPTGNLDPIISDEIIKLFERINEEEGTTIIIVTHDATIVKNHPKRTIKIENGHIVDDRFGLSLLDNLVQASAIKEDLDKEEDKNV